MKMFKYRCVDNIGVEGLLTVGTVYTGYAMRSIFGEIVAVKVTDDTGQKNSGFQGVRFVEL